jgi:phytoene dehydrogenase-like protein
MHRSTVLVIGAGQNGLAAAVRLATAGRRVVVLERGDRAGGLCAPEEFHPGYVAPGILHDQGLVSPVIAGRLGLDRHGLAFRDAPPVLLAEEGGPGILLSRDAAAGDGDLAARAPRDAEAYARYRAFLSRLAPLVQAVMTSPPPPLSPAAPGEYWEIARRGLGVLRLGRRRALELVRVAPMCAADFLNERFQTALLVAGLAAPAVAGTWSGPWSAGTATNLLLGECAPGRLVAGGPPALIAALARAAGACGAEIRTGAEVAEIRVERGAVTGVVLASGETLDAATVVATCDPRQVFLDLVAPGKLPLEVEEEFLKVRARGTAAKVHLALDGPFELAARPGQKIEALRVGGGHVDELERAFDAVKYRQASRHPHLEVRVPTVADPGLAPAGCGVVSILASYAPHDVEGGWTEERRAELLEAVLAALERLAPGVRAGIVASQLLTPADLAARNRLSGGQLHHVEPALDQLLVMRPTAGTARYATPISGLYLGGSGSHGGGGVTCTAGVLAAEVVLRDRGRRRNRRP